MELSFSLNCVGQMNLNEIPNNDGWIFRRYSQLKLRNREQIAGEFSEPLANIDLLVCVFVCIRVQTSRFFPSCYKNQQFFSRLYSLILRSACIFYKLEFHGTLGSSRVTFWETTARIEQCFKREHGKCYF